MAKDEKYDFGCAGNVALLMFCNDRRCLAADADDGGGGGGGIPASISANGTGGGNRGLKSGASWRWCSGGSCAIKSVGEPSEQEMAQLSQLSPQLETQVQRGPADAADAAAGFT